MPKLPDFSVTADCRSGLDHANLHVLEVDLKIRAKPIDRWYRNDGLHLTDDKLEKKLKSFLNEQKALCIWALRQTQFCVRDFFDKVCRSDEEQQARLGMIVNMVGVARQAWTRYRNHEYERDFVQPVKVNMKNLAANICQRQKNKRSNSV